MNVVASVSVYLLGEGLFDRQCCCLCIIVEREFCVPSSFLFGERQIEYMKVMCSIHNGVASVSIPLLGEGRVFDLQCCCLCIFVVREYECMKVVCSIHIPLYHCLESVWRGSD